MDYSKLSDRELDALVAERVMGLKIKMFADEPHVVYDTAVCKSAYTLLVDAYSTDDNAARLVRDRIAELGLNYAFVCALDEITGDPERKSPVFDLMQATPRQQAIAALQALDAKEKP